MFLRNVGIEPKYYTTHQLRISPFTSHPQLPNHFKPHFWKMVKFRRNLSVLCVLRTQLPEDCFHTPLLKLFHYTPRSRFGGEYV
jgi:hypothetical protein